MSLSPRSRPVVAAMLREGSLFLSLRQHMLPRKICYPSIRSSDAEHHPGETVQRIGRRYWPITRVPRDQFLWPSFFRAVFPVFLSVRGGVFDEIEDVPVCRRIVPFLRVPGG